MQTLAVLMIAWCCVVELAIPYDGIKKCRAIKSNLGVQKGCSMTYKVLLASRDTGKEARGSAW